MKKTIIFIILQLVFLGNLNAQSLEKNFFSRTDTLDKPRLIITSSVAAVGYVGMTLALDKLWYADYARSPMHSFDDSQEWSQMDKTGHFFTTYFESKWASDIYRWTGIKRKNAALIGAGTGMLFQTTLEVLDGYSAEWGFSWSDMAANTAGSGLFLAQELAWKEQRIVLKISSHARNSELYNQMIYSSNNPSVSTSLGARSDALYGNGKNPFVQLLKDYNTLTLWSSVNIWSFLPNREESKFPKWLNVAVGYGAENLYKGAPEYGWKDKNGNEFQLNPADYPRYRQIYIAPDIDLTRLPIKNKTLKTLLAGLNVFKFPLPTVEFTTTGQVNWHAFYF